MIPLVNLERQYEKIESEIIDTIKQVCHTRHFIDGMFLSAFERSFKELYQSNGCGCSNGTTAIFLALKALNVGPGDEVITTPLTFIATVEAICHIGAKPVFVDIDPATYTIDAKQIEAAITSKTKAIIPVHLYGNLCDMKPIMGLAQKHHLYIIEDCAQAHLAKYHGEMAGNFGEMAAFSFFPGKNLGAFGDAGFVLAKTEDHERLVRKLANHGRTEKYSHEIIGYNHRMDDIQAAILSIKLKYLEAWTVKRINNADYYNHMLRDRGFKVMESLNGSEPVYHLYVVETSNRDNVVNYLRSKGILASIHYPIPLHLQPALEFLGHQVGDYPVAESVSNRILSLPLCSEITNEEMAYVCDEFLKVAKT